MFLSKTILKLLVLTFVVNGIQCGLPSYMKACSRSDPKLNECAVKVARAAAKTFSRGDVAMGIPKLDPVEIKEIKSGGSGPNQLKIILRDCVVTGTGDLEFRKMFLDMKKKRVTVHLFGDILVESKYTMSGRILIIPLDGSGRAVINIRDIKLVYSFDYDLVKGKDGKEYVKIHKDDIKYEVGKAHFKLDNLFNGDKVLGETTNRILNEQWRDVIGEMSPPIVRDVRMAATASVQKLLSQVPYDELLLP